jgi:hypothetical protein
MNHAGVSVRAFQLNPNVTAPPAIKHRVSARVVQDKPPPTFRVFPVPSRLPPLERPMRHPCRIGLNIFSIVLLRVPVMYTDGSLT